MFKKIITWLLVVVLTASIAIGGTLAYLTDRDSEANVFTVGDVDITLDETFTDNSQLIPGVDVNKDVKIKNEGPNDAWVWYTYAVPQALDGNLDLVYANEVRVSSVEEIQEVLAPEYPYSDVKIVLTEDLIIDKNTPWGYADNNGAHFQIWKNKSVTFDLNGHKIVVKEDAVKDGKTYATALFLVRNASLNLVGPGAIEVNNYAVAVYCWQDQYQKHSVNIYGDVKITSNSVDRNGGASPESIIYIQHADDAANGLDKHLECNIYGGVLDGYALNVADKCTSMHELRQMFVLYEGVKFSEERYDLLQSDLDKELIKLADGCTLEYADGWYTVVGPKEQEQFGGADNGNWLNGQLVGTMEQDGITYNVYVRLYKEILKAEETTTLDLTAVKLAEYVDITPDGQLYKVVDGETVKIDWNITQNGGDTPVIVVTACAIQTEGFRTLEEAYAAFLEQWEA